MRKFSSPSGDGLVPTTAEKRATNAPISVPAWGWVGSWRVKIQSPQNRNFRPRLGMGWFLIYCFRTNCTQIFK